MVGELTQVTQAFGSNAHPTTLKPLSGFKLKDQCPIETLLCLSARATATSTIAWVMWAIEIHILTVLEAGKAKRRTPAWLGSDEDPSWLTDGGFLTDVYMAEREGEREEDGERIATSSSVTWTPVLSEGGSPLRYHLTPIPSLKALSLNMVTWRIRAPT